MYKIRLFRDDLVFNKELLMIICQVIGGLGNQMFQYAAGRALSLSLNSDFFLDLRAFNKYRLHHGFEINRVFCTSVAEADESHVKNLLGWRANELSLRLFRKIGNGVLSGTKLVSEPTFRYWSDFRMISAPCYMMGYWQSEKYFSDYENVIRSDFRFRNPIAGDNLPTYHRMQSSNAVSLHVRRGDYVTNSRNSQLFDVCSPNYYHAAIEYIAENVKSPNFFVFSDDMKWTLKNIKIPFTVEYIDRNRGNQSYIDLHLMSLCKHHIIANSTFSWWSAWLSREEGKIVVAPRNWFLKTLDDRDLVPNRWIRL